MKVYTTDEKDLIMEPCLKWVGNPNVTVAVKAYGLKATVQVVDLQVFAAPRITLKPLVPSFPCFAKILVSLMDKPHVDFGLMLLGAGVMSIPGDYQRSGCKYNLWPKTLEVVIMDPAKAQKSRYPRLLQIQQSCHYVLNNKEYYTCVTTGKVMNCSAVMLYLGIKFQYHALDVVFVSRNAHWKPFKSSTASRSSCWDHTTWRVHCRQEWQQPSLEVVAQYSSLKQ